MRVFLDQRCLICLRANKTFDYFETLRCLFLEETFETSFLKYKKCSTISATNEQTMGEEITMIISTLSWCVSHCGKWKLNERIIENRQLF